ncbi:MAG TPA: DUF177 domain-containing protein [Candidatus Eisenbacteria bacterium]|nr:DUF177 domain-containing protein [Candidatus Eisenbacteria bacterium]
MKILLGEIPQGHSVIDRRESAAAIDIKDWVMPKADVHVVLDADRRGQQVTMRGLAELDVEYSCARCLREFGGALAAPVLVLADRRGSDDPRDEEALEQEGAVIYHEGVEIDLGPSIRDALILEVPQVVLCRPECRGLCSSCGQDRNEGECNCAPGGMDPRWEQLRQLNREKT